MKRVIFTKQPNVNVKDCDPNNIYVLCVCSEKYRLCQTDIIYDEWAWERIDRSIGYWWNDRRKSFEDALNSVSGYEVYEFTSLKDYAKWLYEKEVTK